MKLIYYVLLAFALGNLLTCKVESAVPNESTQDEISANLGEHADLFRKAVIFLAHQAFQPNVKLIYETLNGFHQEAIHVGRAPMENLKRIVSLERLLLVKLAKRVIEEFYDGYKGRIGVLDDPLIHFLRESGKKDGIILETAIMDMANWMYAVGELFIHPPPGDMEGFIEGFPGVLQRWSILGIDNEPLKSFKSKKRQKRHLCKRTLREWASSSLDEAPEALEDSKSLKERPLWYTISEDFAIMLVMTSVVLIAYNRMR